MIPIDMFRYGHRSWWSTLLIVMALLWGQHGCSFQLMIQHGHNPAATGRGLSPNNKHNHRQQQETATVTWHPQNMRLPSRLDSCHQCSEGSTPTRQNNNNKRSLQRLLGSVLDVLQPAGFASSILLLDDKNDTDETKTTTTSTTTTTSMVVHTAGPLRFIPKRIRRLHDPMTYFAAGLITGFRYTWCFESPLYYFAMGFLIKWYRARYVYRIPVWDRQPNWNNVITNKSQEKDLKAVTCKNCGTTLFIAKTREFFFEGNTGIGGLGCFHCGAKGKDNFIYDRDRIVEDVGDMDDYFEYERPLDFVSRAERRKLLKEAEGDENKANQLLLERNKKNGESTTTTTTTTIADGSTTVPNVSQPSSKYIDVEVEKSNNVVSDANGPPSETPPKKKKKKKKSVEDLSGLENDKKEKESVAVLPVEKPAVMTSRSSNDDDLSVLDMDAW